jgi:hypothetical protein
LREQLLRTLLDVLRRSLAVKVDVLDRNKQRDLIDQTIPRLLEGTVWYIEDARELVSAVVAYPRSKLSGEQRSDLFVSSFGSYGQYLRRSLKPFVQAGEDFKRPEVDQAIQFLFEALKRYGIVEQVRYTAYGEVRGRWNAAGNRIGGQENPNRRYQFTGYHTESYSRLQYAGARFYDSAGALARRIRARTGTPGHQDGGSVL